MIQKEKKSIHSTIWLKKVILIAMPKRHILAFQNSSLIFQARYIKIIARALRLTIMYPVFIPKQAELTINLYFKLSPLQSRPSPVNPLLQVHVYEPSVLLHVASS